MLDAHRGLGGSARGLIAAMTAVAVIAHALAALLLAWGAQRYGRNVPEDDRWNPSGE